MNSTRQYFLLLLYVANLMYAEGFSPDTLVHTQQGLRSIENVNCDEYILIDNGHQIHSYLVMNKTIENVDHYIKITIKDISLCIAANQKLYVVSKGWICADKLQLSDLLLCENKKFAELIAIETIYENQAMHALSIQPGHILCVTKYGIIVHNTELIGASIATIVLPLCPPLATAIAITDIVGLAVIGFATYLVHKKAKHNHQADRYSHSQNNTNYCPCGGKPPQHENDEDEHPNGIYEDADYHHFNSYGKKSACPNNGQKCLDKSFPVYKSTTLRITIEEGRFVILRQSIPGKFHGYIVESWQELCNEGSKTQLIRNAFQKHKLVNKVGKIIKNI